MPIEAATVDLYFALAPFRESGFWVRDGSRGRWRIASATSPETPAGVGGRDARLRSPRVLRRHRSLRYPSSLQLRRR